MSEIERRKSMIKELSTITTYNLSAVIGLTSLYSFNQLQEIKACILYGLSFDQSTSLVDLIKNSHSNLTVHEILKAINYGQ